MRISRVESNMKNMFAATVKNCNFEFLMIFEILHANCTLSYLCITLRFIICPCLLVNEIIYDRNFCNMLLMLLNGASEWLCASPSNYAPNYTASASNYTSYKNEHNKSQPYHCSDNCYNLIEIVLWVFI